MIFYYIKALFTSVPVDPSINIVKQNYSRTLHCPQRTNMSIKHIITLLEFCLKIHTSSSKVSIMNRSMVLPWIPPSAPSLPTSLWKSLRSRPLALPHTLQLWLRYVDDTFVIQEAEHSQQLQWNNTQDLHTIFHGGTGPRWITTIPRQLGFPGPNNTLTITVYRKPTHTDQYLH